MNYLKDKKLTEAVKQYIISHYEYFEEARKPLMGKINKGKKQYLNIGGEKFYNGTAQIFVPATFNAVETLVPRIVQGLIGKREFFKIESTNVGMAKKLQQFILNQIKRMDFKNKFTGFVRNICIKGTGVAKVFRDQQIEFLPYGSNKDPQAEVVYDGANFENVNLENIYVNPAIADIQKQPIVIEKIKTTYANVKRQEKKVVTFGEHQEEHGMYENVDSIKLSSPSDKGISSEEKEIYHARGISIDDTKNEVSSKFDNNKDKKLFNQITLLECWFLYDINGDGYLESCVATLANKDTLIRLEENPFKHKKFPYVKGCLIDVEGHFYGVSVPEIVGDLQKELNDTRNQLMDFKTFVLDNMWIVSEEADVQDEQLTPRPHAIIRSKGSGEGFGIIPLRPNMNILGAGIQIENLIQDNIRTASMATESLQGLTHKGGVTATEVARVQQESMSRLLLVMRGLEASVIVKFLMMCYQLNLQYMKTGDEDVQNQDVLPDAIFSALGSIEIESQMVKAQQLINLLNIVGSIPPSPSPQGIVRLSALKIAEKLYELYGYHDFNEMIEVLPPPPRVQGVGNIQNQNQPKPTTEADVMRNVRERRK